MDETTSVQNKIRRATLLISMLLLLVSLGSYFIYQRFYRTELQVKVVRKRVLPNTGTNKSLIKKTKKVPVSQENPFNESLSFQLQDNEINRDPLIDYNHPPKPNASIPSSKLFKLSNEIKPLP